MKKTIKFIFSTFTLMLLPIMTILADPPGPPGPGGSPIGGGGVPVGAPIDSGVFVLLALGVAYGALKLYQNNFNKQRILKEKESE